MKPANSFSTDIDSLLKKRKIIITCGTGGVGKTTLSASLAVRAALLGKNAVVITMDPAKRLATSLGLKSLGDTPTDLTPRLQKMSNAPSQKPLGKLSAIMPDTQKTLEAFILSLTPSQAIADPILRNPIFQMFSKEFSGTNEYMALERLFTLYSQGTYDCIILDTPPSRNTLAFLEGPSLLSRFFEENLIRSLVLPANKLVAAGMKTALGLLEKLTGSGFMTSLYDFAAGLFEVRVKFAANLKKITLLLESDEVGFLQVAAPHPDTVPETLHFIRALSDHHFHFEGIALNRSLGYLKILQNGSENTSENEKAGMKILASLQKKEAETISKLRAALKSETYLNKLPELARDVHSMEDLFHVAMALNHPFSAD